MGEEYTEAWTPEGGDHWGPHHQKLPTPVSFSLKCKLYRVVTRLKYITYRKCLTRCLIDYKYSINGSLTFFRSEFDFFLLSLPLVSDDVTKWRVQTARWQKQEAWNSLYEFQGSEARLLELETGSAIGQCVNLEQVTSPFCACFVLLKCK